MSENKIKTLPWRLAHDNPRKIVSDCIHGFDPLTQENVIGGASQHHDEKLHASAIVSAVNGTYGVGISPDAVKDMQTVLQELLEWNTKYPFEKMTDYKRALAADKAIVGIIEKTKDIINKSKL
jgi:hypothetical protein